MTRVEKFTVALFGVFAALLILPALLVSVISVVSTGAIDLPH